MGSDHRNHHKNHLVRFILGAFWPLKLSFFGVKNKQLPAFISLGKEPETMFLFFGQKTLF
jgi:hypothetical protein